jgi:hypothetical protein
LKSSKQSTTRVGLHRCATERQEAGGDKSSQSRDIAMAHELAKML